MTQPPPPPFDIETEHRLTALETRLDVILPTLATKADIAEVKAAIAESKSSLLVWGLTTAVAVVAILVSVMFFLAAESQLTSGDDATSQRIVSRIPTMSTVTSTSTPPTTQSKR